MDTEHSVITEPVRRLEVFTGAGRRRTWSDEDKARIVAEIATSGESVCAVARRHGLSPQQLFGWRRQLREAAGGHSEAEECSSCQRWWSGVCAAVARRKALRARPSSAGTIEVEVDGVTIRAGRGADVKTLLAMLRALKAARDRPDRRGPGDGGDQACRLPQGSGGTGDAGARDHEGRSVLGRGLCVPGQAGGPDQADLLGRHGSVPVRQTAGGRHLPLAEDRRRCDAFVGGAIVGAAGRAGLAARS